MRVLRRSRCAPGSAGITVREGALLEGDAGWGEWSPFLEYDARGGRAVAAAAPRRPRPATGPRPCATPVPGQRDGARRRARAGARDRGGRRLPDRQGEGGRARPDARRRPGPGRGRPRRARAGRGGSGSTPTAAGTSTTRWPRSGALDRAAGGLEYVEQPCATVEDLAAVRRAVDVPIAADESIRRAADPYRVRDLEAADVAVLKVQPLGGVRACLRIAEEIGLPVVVSSALETSVGIAAGVALAAALPELPYACGLATVQLLTDDVAVSPLLPVDGALPVGVPERRRGRARTGSPRPPERVAAWEARLAEVRRAAAGSRLVTRTPRPSWPARWSRALLDGRRQRGRARARVAQRAARVRGLRRRRGGPGAAAHPDRRAHGRLPRARADQGRRRAPP